MALQAMYVGEAKVKRNAGRGLRETYCTIECCVVDIAIPRHLNGNLVTVRPGTMKIMCWHN
jgi:hypothetical protein